MKEEVIFRKNRYGDIVAVFPYIKTDSVGNMTCYAHVGQHSSCCIDWYRKDTKAAKPDEYKDLYNELVNHVGYQLIVKKNLNYNLMRLNGINF